MCVAIGRGPLREFLLTTVATQLERQLEGNFIFRATAGEVKEGGLDCGLGVNYGGGVRGDWRAGIRAKVSRAKKIVAEANFLRQTRRFHA